MQRRLQAGILHQHRGGIRPFGRLRHYAPALRGGRGVARLVGELPGCLWRCFAHACGHILHAGARRPLWQWFMSARGTLEAGGGKHTVRGACLK